MWYKYDPELRVCAIHIQTYCRPLSIGKISIGKGLPSCRFRYYALPDSWQHQNDARSIRQDFNIAGRLQNFKPGIIAIIIDNITDLEAGNAM